VHIALIAPLVTPIGEPHIGGAQAVVADLAAELVARRHDVVVFASRGSSIAGVRVTAIDAEPAALRDDLFRAGEEATASAAMTGAYRAVYAAVREGGFDAVHNHGFDAPAVTEAARAGVPVLHTLHLPPSRVIASALDTARRDGATPLWCAAVSQAHADAWRAHVPVDVVLRNGVPMDAIHFESAPGDAAVVAARFSAEKGVGDGIAACRRAGLAVDVYGTAYDPGYERHVRGLWDADPAVTFHPPLVRTALWQALGAATVVVCLSRWEEPFGMVAAEAQAAGTPVVASRAGGLVEVVRHGVTGWLVPRDHPGAAVQALWRVGSLSRAACRRHAERALGLAAAVDAHERIYSRIARGRG
jgi:UDP-glucose:tetrahydrobiopterin glucosyltransferase